MPDYYRVRQPSQGGIFYGENKRNNQLSIK